MRCFRIDYLDEHTAPDGSAVVTLRFHATGLSPEALRELVADRALPAPAFGVGDRVTISAECKEGIATDIEAERIEGDRTHASADRAREALRRGKISIATIEASAGQWMYSLKAGKVEFPGLHPAEDLKKVTT